MDQRVSGIPVRARWRRFTSIVGTTVILFTLGAATNLLVAWSCAMHAQAWGGNRVFASDGSAWTFIDWVGRHKAIYEVLWWSSDEPVENWTAPAPELLESHLPRWAKLPKRTEGIAHSIYRLESAGWPWLAFSGTQWYEVDQSIPRDERAFSWDNLKSRFIVSGPLRDLQQQHLLPMRPIWPGFYLGSALFMLPWAALFALVYPLAWREHRRARRGLCPRCSYDLSYDLCAGCPECGWLRAADSGVNPGVATRRRRACETLIVCFMCGALLSVVVAGAGSVFGVTGVDRGGAEQYTGRRDQEPSGWSWQRAEGLAYRVHMIREESHIRAFLQRGGPAPPPISEPDLDAMKSPRWARADPYDGWSVIEFVGAGWPAVSFTATRAWRPGPPAQGRVWWAPAELSGGVLLSRQRQNASSAGYGGILPVRPLWSGVLINAVVFTVPVYLAGMLWRKITRYRITPASPRQAANDVCPST